MVYKSGIVVPDPFWWERWQALRKTIDDTRLGLNVDCGKDSKAATSSEDSAKEEHGGDDNLPSSNPLLEEGHCSGDPKCLDTLFAKLLCRLLGFGDKQFCYFFFGFGGTANGEDCETDETPKLLYEREMHPDYVLRRTYDQLTEDFETIQRALFVRKNGTVDEKATLKFADSWGAKLLPVAGIKGAENSDNRLVFRAPFVITYFDRYSQIRTLPYANVVLVGIPYSSTVPLKVDSVEKKEENGESATVEVPHDLFIMGHEIGHYVYRNGEVRNGIVAPQPLSTSLAWATRQRPRYLRNWLEEIFCDVYSVLTIGDPQIVSFVDKMVGDNTLETLLKDPGRHPIDAIRPHIYVKVYEFLAEMLGPGTDAANAVDKRKCMVQSEWFDAQTEFLTTDNFGMLEKRNIIDEIRNNIGPVIQKIVELLWPYVAEPARKPTPTNRPAHLADLFRTAEEYIEARIDGYPESNYDPFDIIRETPYGRAIDPTIWKIVFHANGWIDAGPPAETHATGGAETHATGGGEHIYAQ